MKTATPLLQIRDVTKQFGGLLALDQLNLDVYKGEILGIIGPNGAGKTTLFNAITGFDKPTRGTITFHGKDIAGLSPHKIASQGIIRTFQITGVFEDLTVMDNMRLGCHLTSRTDIFRSILGSRFLKKQVETDRSVLEILSLLGMDHLKDHLAGDLSHGYHRNLTVAIPLAARPELLLLDEPITLLDAERAETMTGFLRKMRDRGVTIVVVEHHMKLMFNLCDRIAVLNYGNKLAEGSPEEIRSNGEVIAAYLGRK